MSASSVYFPCNTALDCNVTNVNACIGPNYAIQTSPMSCDYTNTVFCSYLQNCTCMPKEGFATPAVNNTLFSSLCGFCVTPISAIPVPGYSCTVISTTSSTTSSSTSSTSPTTSTTSSTTTSTTSSSTSSTSPTTSTTSSCTTTSTTSSFINNITTSTRIMNSTVSTVSNSAIHLCDCFYSSLQFTNPITANIILPVILIVRSIKDLILF